VSNFTAPLLERCEQVGHVQSLQPPLSMVRREALGEDLDWCRRHRAGVICYSPLQSGLLTGEFTRERLDTMAEDDWRRKNGYFQEPTLSGVLDLVEQARLVADEHEVTVAELAIAWVIAQPGVTGAIVGARTPEQVKGWIGAGILDLSDGVAGDLLALAELAPTRT
jgi:aryl-alcohol dehydrogenase-like predicted oxidoreductase